MASCEVQMSIKMVTDTCPDMEDMTREYIMEILSENAKTFESSEDIYEAIGHFLHDADPSINESTVHSVCGKVFELLKPDGHVQHEALDAPVHMASLMDNFSQRVVEGDSIWQAKKDVNSMIDVDKLKKAEAKLRDKQDKKAAITNLPSNFQPIALDEVASVSQQVDRRQVASDERNEDRNVTEICLSNFDISFGARHLLVGANLSLSAGRRYGLVGRNGYGKTTLLKSISRRELVLPRNMTIVHVEQELQGDATEAIESVLLADEERAALLAEQTKLMIQHTAEADVRLAEIHHRLDEIEADKAPARAAVVLKGLGFDAAMQRRETRTFSGGWRMRLALARALFARPNLLLLDEPTNMLDMRAIIWLEDYLQTWQSMLLVVSHDRAFLNNICTDIIHLTACRLDEYKGDYDAFEGAREERLLNQRREYEAQKAERQHIQEFIDKFRYNAKRATLVQSRIKQLERMPPLIVPDKEVKVSVNLPDCDKLGGTVLRLDQVSFHYTPEKPILVDVDLSVTSDSRVIIVGENGAGKTTLLRLLLGELEPTGGLRHVHRNLRIGYFSQHHVDQLELNLSSLDFVSRKYPNLGESAYRGQLAAFGITEMLAMQPIGSLSGGQKSRVAFAAMCLQKPNILILDEPTNHLDMETIASLSEALKTFKGAVVLVSHDERLIDAVCTELWVCSRYMSQAGSLSVQGAAGSRVRTLEGGLAEYKALVRRQLNEALASN